MVNAAACAAVVVSHGFRKDGNVSDFIYDIQTGRCVARIRGGLVEDATKEGRGLPIGAVNGDRYFDVMGRLVGFLHRV